MGALYYSREIPSLLRGLRLSKLFGREGVITFESNGGFVVARRRGQLPRFILPGFRDIRGYQAMYRDFVTGIRTGLGFAWRGLIAAEMIATNVGLGYMLFVARDFYQTEVIILGMIVIGTLWLLIDRLILAPLERATIERWGLVRA